MKLKEDMICYYPDREKQLQKERIQMARDMAYGHVREVFRLKKLMIGSKVDGESALTPICKHLWIVMLSN